MDLKVLWIIWIVTSSSIGFVIAVFIYKRVTAKMNTEIFLDNMMQDIKQEMIMNQKLK